MESRLDRLEGKLDHIAEVLVGVNARVSSLETTEKHMQLWVEDTKSLQAEMHRLANQLATLNGKIFMASGVFGLVVGGLINLGFALLRQ